MELHDARAQRPIQVPQEAPRRILFVSPTVDDAPSADSDGTIVVTAVTLPRGLTARHLRGFDALVVDWTGLDDEGRTFLDRLRRANSPLATIAVVPPHAPEAVRAARRAGAMVSVLKTPDYRLHLPQAIEAAIEQVRLRRENHRLGRALQAARRRKEHLQRQLKVLLDRLAEGVLILDAGDGRIVAANAAAEQLWGVPLRRVGRLDSQAGLRAEAADGTPIPAEASAPLRALRRGEAIFDEPVVLQPDARRIPATVDAVPLRTTDGTLAGVVSLVRDRSAPVQLASLREALVAVASHQLKNPLTVILGYSSLLLNSPALAADSRTRRAVVRIRREGLRLRHLADNLLEFSRLELGRDVVRAVPFDLADLVQSVVVRRREAASPRSVRLQLAPMAISCVGDYGRLAQVLDSLIEQRSVDAGAQASEVGVALGRHTATELATAGASVALPPGEAFATIVIGAEPVADWPALRRAAWRPITGIEPPRDPAELDVLVSAALVRKHGGILYASQEAGGGAYLLVLPIT